MPANNKTNLALACSANVDMGAHSTAARDADNLSSYKVDITITLDGNAEAAWGNVKALVVRAATLPC